MQMGDSVFMFFSALLVWIMTPAIALFYGGMVRSKNMLSTAMYSVGSLAVISVLWIVAGYSLAFSTGGNAFIGNLDWVGLKGVGFTPNGDYSATIPHNMFMMFQLTFAVLTVAIISGAFAERMKFSAFILFAILWSLFVYAPVAHWVWGVGGWLRELGAIDFAGGNVVHISSGVAGLILALVVGKRKNADAAAPHNLPLTLLGGMLIWFGWFGFNVGSSLTINSVAMTAFINTNTAAATGIIGWLVVEWIINKKPTLLGAVSGAIAGLVAITPACGFVTPFASIVIGFIGGAVCFWGIFSLKKKIGYDDALDAFGLHGIGGTWGGIATGLFATTSVNDAGANGLFYGDPSLLWKQLVAIVATYLFVGIATFIIVKVVGLIVSLRATQEEETLGLDITLHGERAYHESNM
ncbi:MULTISPECIES: ammonium transporter [Priestia]|jgi:ammonium transporter, Amt family|uniref:Ammonium transporter n=6 Tax=Priestia TaxID=2800373 RepID=D5DV70_PRIM1|nr:MULTISPECIES: ammonium transporter [Priestia]AVX08926.1 ammonium transporter [Bacillus sp. Y-01]KOP75062.1 ammonia channel protein [Bacillus sp. FJAT-21351]KQU21887.1 ammonia channel protein [Bacillus sp. Leaf75]KRD90782.1 ammonia channel protein [Bacillus sp. Root147]KRD99700.1 ammonia channel protein [Bacillus sp. Root239]KRF56364.1 ammonia channel protein [Bacillus sp. Soil531]MBK0005466.1 ammonium transporter [Bacillus sp. S35]MCF6796830.1 ammonium transporter [Bacillus sp. ET1]MDH6